MFYYHTAVDIGGYGIMGEMSPATKRLEKVLLEKKIRDLRRQQHQRDLDIATLKQTADLLEDAKDRIKELTKDRDLWEHCAKLKTYLPCGCPSFYGYSPDGKGKKIICLKCEYLRTQQETGWRPVTEEPEECAEVLIYPRPCSTPYVIYMEGTYGMHGRVYNPTHWMPIPKAPQTQEEANEQSGRVGEATEESGADEAGQGPGAGEVG